MSASEAHGGYKRALGDLAPIPKEGIHTIRVLYLEDPRLPAFGAARRKALYARTEGLLKSWYGYSAEFKEVRAESLEKFFTDEKSAGALSFAKNASQIGHDDIDLSKAAHRKKLRKIIEEDVERRSMEQLKEYFDIPENADKNVAAAIAQQTFMSRLSSVRAITVAGGETFFSKRHRITQAFAYWHSVMSELGEADFILTNSSIVGADTSMPIYVISRGGITNGFVTQSVLNAYGAVGMVGLFPFLSDDPFFLEHRGKVEESEREDLIATFWMHELGHFFLRAEEMYGEPGCVHAAPIGLKTLQRYRAIKQSANTCTRKPKPLKRL